MEKQKICFCCFKKINLEITHPLFLEKIFCSKKCLKTDFSKFYRICKFCKKLNSVFDSFFEKENFFCNEKCFGNFVILSKTINEFKFKNDKENFDEDKNNIKNDNKNFDKDKENFDDNKNFDEDNKNFDEDNKNFDADKENFDADKENLDFEKNIDLDFDDLL